MGSYTIVKPYRCHHTVVYSLANLSVWELDYSSFLAPKVKQLFAVSGWSVLISRCHHTSQLYDSCACGLWSIHSWLQFR